MRLHWLHTDCISTGWFDPTDGPAVFVFDDVQIEREQWGLKRIGFIYECLLELDVTILRGPTAPALTAFAIERNCERIAAMRTPDPWLTARGQEIRNLEWIDPAPFVELPARTDLTRFSRYWRRAERLLLPEETG